MGMHAVLYRSSQAIGATNASLSAIGFSQDVVTNNKILPINDCELVSATVFGVGVIAARIQTPLIIQTGSVALRPFGIAATTGSNPNTCDLFDNPVALRASENIDVQTTNGDAAAQIQNAILMLGDRKYSMPSGPTYNIHAVGATTLTAAVWTRVPLVFDDNLPNRLYSIIGFEALSATGLISRLDIPGQALKPGVPTVTAVGNRMFWKHYDLGLGELGRFSNQALPALEQFATAADTAQQVWLKIKVIG